MTEIYRDLIQAIREDAILAVRDIMDQNPKLLPLRRPLASAAGEAPEDDPEDPDDSDEEEEGDEEGIDAGHGGEDLAVDSQSDSDYSDQSSSQLAPPLTSEGSPDNANNTVVEANINAAASGPPPARRKSPLEVLEICCLLGRTEITRMLVEEFHVRVSPRKLSLHVFTPIEVAAQHNHAETVRVLLDHVDGKYHIRVLVTALSIGSTSLLDVLWETASMDVYSVLDLDVLEIYLFEQLPCPANLPQNLRKLLPWLLDHNLLQSSAITAIISRLLWLNQCHTASMIMDKVGFPFDKHEIVCFDHGGSEDIYQLLLHRCLDFASMSARQRMVILVEFIAYYHDDFAQDPVRRGHYPWQMLRHLLDVDATIIFREDTSLIDGRPHPSSRRKQPMKTCLDQVIWMGQWDLLRLFVEYLQKQAFKDKATHDGALPPPSAPPAVVAATERRGQAAILAADQPAPPEFTSAKACLNAIYRHVGLQYLLACHSGSGDQIKRWMLDLQEVFMQIAIRSEKVAAALEAADAAATAENNLRKQQRQNAKKDKDNRRAFIAAGSASIGDSMAAASSSSSSVATTRSPMTSSSSSSSSSSAITTFSSSSSSASTTSSPVKTPTVSSSSAATSVPASFAWYQQWELTFEQLRASALSILAMNGHAELFAFLHQVYIYGRRVAAVEEYVVECEEMLFPILRQAVACGNVVAIKALEDALLALNASCARQVAQKTIKHLRQLFQAPNTATHPQAVQYFLSAARYAKVGWRPTKLVQRQQLLAMLDDDFIQSHDDCDEEARRARATCFICLIEYLIVHYYTSLGLDTNSTSHNNISASAKHVVAGLQTLRSIRYEVKLHMVAYGQIEMLHYLHERHLYLLPDCDTDYDHRFVHTVCSTGRIDVLQMMVYEARSRGGDEAVYQMLTMRDADDLDVIEGWMVAQANGHLEMVEYIQQELQSIRLRDRLATEKEKADKELAAST